jgi:hypothetical protein
MVIDYSSRLVSVRFKGAGENRIIILKILLTVY